MKHFTVIALILSVLLVQTVVAQGWKDDSQDWKDGIVEEYSNKYAWFVAARTNILNKLATTKNNPQTSECVKEAKNHLQLAKPDVKNVIENCVNSARSRVTAQQCAQRSFNTLVAVSKKQTRC